MIRADEFPTGTTVPSADGLPAGPFAIGVCDRRSVVLVFKEYPRTYA